jgi:hypothetical protein
VCCHKKSLETLPWDEKERLFPSTFLCSLSLSHEDSFVCLSLKICICIRIIPSVTCERLDEREGRNDSGLAASEIPITNVRIFRFVLRPS